MTDTSTRRRIDTGRVAVVPIAALLASSSLASVVRGIAGASLMHPEALLALIGPALIVCFYALMVTMYLRRGSAHATTASRPAKAAALTATWMPFVLPYVSGHHSTTATMLGSDVLLVAGMTWSVVSLRTLGRSFSIIAQARKVVCDGPYAVVRHPLYLGELVAILGVVLRAPSVAGLALWCLLVALQCYRTGHEERVLSDTLPDYSSYQSLTRWRLVPGVL